MLQLACSEKDAQAATATTRAMLVDGRKRRPAPHLDDKLLTCWNGRLSTAVNGCQPLISKTKSSPAGTDEWNKLRASKQSDTVSWLLYSAINISTRWSSGVDGARRRQDLTPLSQARYFILWVFSWFRVSVFFVMLSCFSSFCCPLIYYLSSCSASYSVTPPAPPVN